MVNVTRTIAYIQILWVLDMSGSSRKPWIFVADLPAKNDLRLMTKIPIWFLAKVCFFLFSAGEFPAFSILSAFFQHISDDSCWLPDPFPSLATESGAEFHGGALAPTHEQWLSRGFSTIQCIRDYHRELGTIGNPYSETTRTKRTDRFFPKPTIVICPYVDSKCQLMSSISSSLLLKLTGKSWW